jgi:hypothetical protein
MNFWELRKDSVLLLLPIDAILLYLRLLVCFMVVLQLVLPELVKLRLSRTWEELLVFSSSSLTAQMSINTEIWQRFSREFAKVDFGDVLMNSIVFHSLLYQSSQPKSNQSLKLRNKDLRDLCSLMKLNQLL